MLKRTSLLQALAVAVLLLAFLSGPVSASDAILDFTDIPPGTLLVFSPYQSQGFTLTSNSGGFVLNSPDTGNGSPQPPGNNPFYAGANGLAAFAPATITLVRTDGDPFSLLSIALARNFESDPAPTVSFTGTLQGGGTVSQSFPVMTPSGPPAAFEEFSFTGFTNVTSVSWDQPSPTAGLHQFTNITLSIVPEPSSVVMGAVGAIALAAVILRARRRPAQT